MIIANASGCSSVWGGTALTSPYSKDSDGRGPSWARSLFEDNAEYGYGMLRAREARREKLLHNCKEAKDIPELSEQMRNDMTYWIANLNDNKKADEVYK